MSKTMSREAVLIRRSKPLGRNISEPSHRNLQKVARSVSNPPSNEMNLTAECKWTTWRRVMTIRADASHALTSHR